MVTILSTRVVSFDFELFYVFHEKKYKLFRQSPNLFYKISNNHMGVVRICDMGTRLVTITCDME